MFEGRSCDAPESVVRLQPIPVLMAMLLKCDHSSVEIIGGKMLRWAPENLGHAQKRPVPVEVPFVWNSNQKFGLRHANPRKTQAGIGQTPC